MPRKTLMILTILSFFVPSLGGADANGLDQQKLDIPPAPSPILVAAAELSPEGEMALTQCEQQQTAKLHYSCSCIAENIGTYVDENIAKHVQVNNQAITGYEAGIKKNSANPNFSEEQKEQKTKAGLYAIETKKQSNAKLLDRANWDDNMRRSMVSGALQKIYRNSLCKRSEGIREQEYKNCFAAYSLSPVKGKTDEEYCTCSADKTAEMWTDPSGKFSAQVSSVKARQQCRK